MSAGLSVPEFTEKVEKLDANNVNYIYVYRTNLTNTGTVVINFTDKGKITTLSTVFYKLDNFVEKFSEKLGKKIEYKLSYPVSFFGVIASYLPILFYLLFFG